jgi:predicted anti-sigma-YlaC factor YlaD
MLEMTWVRWVLAAIAVAAIVAMLAWARHDAGVDDRVPDPEDAIAAIVIADGVHAGV